MTPLFFGVSIMQSSSLITGKNEASGVVGVMPTPITQGRRPSLIDDRCRAISTTMPLPTLSPSEKAITTSGVFSLARMPAAKASMAVVISRFW
jgi:hypothetical protein